jgi:ABC-2 type transport system permease protein
MDLKITLSLMRKEFLQIVRDPSAIAIAFVLPLILLFIFGYGISLDSGLIKLGILNQSDSAESRALIASYLNSPFFKVKLSRDKGELLRDLDRGDLRGILIIPQDFERIRKIKGSSGGKGSIGGSGSGNFTGSEIMIITDGTESNSANFVRTHTLGVKNSFDMAILRDAGYLSPEPLITLESRYRYNPELSSKNFVIPGSLSVVMTLTGLLLTALVIAREWERGTMESLMSAPVGITSIILAKLAAYFILGFVSAFLCFSFSVFWYGVPFRGGLIALGVLSSVFLLSALGQGLLISTITKDQYVASQVAIVTGFLPSFFLSGFIFEIASMPAPIRAVSHLVSARYLVPSLQTVFLAGDIWALFLWSLAFMGLIGLVFYAITVGRLKKRID